MVKVDLKRETEKQMNETQRKIMVYYIARDVLIRLLAQKSADREVLERINMKNAEKMGCRAEPI